MNKSEALLLVLSLMCAIVLALVGSLDAQMEGITDLTEREALTPEDIIPSLRLTGVRGTPGIAITVLFASNSAQPSPEARQNLNSLAKVLQTPEFAGDRFEIIGYTDSVGSYRSNQRLSERRANSVRQYLVREFRISQERLLTAGRGECDPIAKNNTAEGRKKNRRVVVKNLGTASSSGTVLKPCSNETTE